MSLETTFITDIYQFAEIRSYSGKVDRKDPVKALGCFEAAFEALGGLCADDQDPESIKKARTKLQTHFADIIKTDETEIEKDNRALLVRELAQAVIGQAKLCAEFEEWKITKRSYVKDAGDKILGGIEIVGGVVGSTLASPLFWTGTIAGGKGFRPKYNLLQVPGIFSMAAVYDGWERTKKPTALTIKQISNKIQEIAKKVDPFVNAKLPAEK